jgi:adenylate kinase
MHRIFLLGPQGSGKGTQAALLSRRLGIPALSMGQLLRDAAMGTNDLAARIRAIQERGDLVPGSIVVEVLRQRLEQSDAISGYILDGFPRNQDQYDAYAAHDVPTAVVVIHVPREESIERIMHRARTEQRADDTPDVINHRLDLYYEVTDPMIENYRQQGLVRDVDGMGTIEEVAERIFGICTQQGGC